MSTQLKLFIDLLGDLFTIRQVLGCCGLWHEPRTTADVGITVSAYVRVFRNALRQRLLWRFKTNDQPFPNLRVHAKEVGTAWIS